MVGYGYREIWGIMKEEELNDFLLFKADCLVFSERLLKPNLHRTIGVKF